MNTKIILFVIILQIILIILFGCFTKYNQNNEVKNLTDKIERTKLILITFFIQCAIFIIFVGFCKYSPNSDASNQQNSISETFGGFNKKKDLITKSFGGIHTMIFIGFGYLMTFLKRYGYSAVGFNFLLAALIVQWAILCVGFFSWKDNTITIGTNTLVDADISAATVLISMGAVLGRTTYIQLLLMGLIEIAVYATNLYLCKEIFKISDVGGSIVVHIFGAYFGLAMSFILEKRRIKSELSPPFETSNYTSDLFSMIGTLFLWICWPYFNSFGLTGDDERRAFINTYLSLAGCCVTTFVMSGLLTENHKFDIMHIQNSTLAGGVAVGTAANLMLEPFGAVIVGILAGILSVFGYVLLTPRLNEKYLIHDTCGVHNLHGMPGILAGLIGAIMTCLANEDSYSMSLYEIFPAMASPDAQSVPEYPFLKAGDGRSALTQAGYQVLAVVVTLAIAIVSGLITGICLNKPSISIRNDDFYNDDLSWKLENEL